VSILTQQFQSNSSRRLSLLTVLIFSILLSPQRTRAQAGRVVGHIDHITFDGIHPTIAGWACQQGESNSIEVQVYADDKLLVAGKADHNNEPAVTQACRDQGGKHRFQIQLPSEPFTGAEKTLAVRGIPVRGGADSTAVSGSGTTRFRIPSASTVPTRNEASAPGLSGSYVSSSTYPRVFNTPGELEALVRRINTPGTYSASRFNQLASQVEKDMSSGKNWSAAYSGCNSDTYNYAFSYEPQTIENEDHTGKVRAELRLGANAKPPGGAAVVASRDALYAALVKAGAKLPKGAPNPDQAAALAKGVLLTWSAHGFRDSQGRILSTANQFCDGDGKFNEAASVGAGLVVSRGIIYYVQAQDLLTYRGDLNAAEQKQTNAFDTAIFDLLLNVLNYSFSEHHAWDCDHYSNHPANQLVGLLALARILDNREAFETILSGKGSTIRVTLPWVVFFQRAIYGEKDTPNACYPNKGADGSSSRPFFQTSTVAPGEIDDRYRNADPGKGIGYPMFTLERLYDAAEIMRNAGYDPYGYRGSHNQSIEMATSYYACFAKNAGFFKVVSAQNSGSCADATQYYGKIVNGVDRLMLIGALRFPENASIGSVESAAKTAATSGPFSLDSILFGRWRD